MQEELKRECQNRRHAHAYIDLAHHTAHLQYELECMWEQELMCD